MFNPGAQYNVIMKTGEKALACLLSGAVLCGGSAMAVPADNPYQGIVERNVFGLKPPPPPPDPAEANKPQPANITLTGITTILGNKRVLMKTAPKPGKPGEAPKEMSYILTEGQRDGDIEVLSIDEVAGAVKIRNAGEEMTLTFEKNGAKLPSTPAPGPVPGAPPALPGMPGMPAPGAPQPAVNPGVPGAPGGANPFSIPTRALRMPSAAGQTTPGYGNAMNQANPAYGSAALGSYGSTYAGGRANVPGAQAGAGGLTLPSFAGTAPASGITESKAAMPDKLYTREEQVILIEAARQGGDPFAAMLPPTELNPNANVMTGSGTGTGTGAGTGTGTGTGGTGTAGQTQTRGK